MECKFKKCETFADVAGLSSKETRDDLRMSDVVTFVGTLWERERTVYQRAN